MTTPNPEDVTTFEEDDNPETLAGEEMSPDEADISNYDDDVLALDEGADD